MDIVPRHIEGKVYVLLHKQQKKAGKKISIYTPPPLLSLLFTLIYFSTTTE